MCLRSVEMSIVAANGYDAGWLCFCYLLGILMRRRKALEEMRKGREDSIISHINKLHSYELHKTLMKSSRAVWKIP